MPAKFEVSVFNRFGDISI